MIAWMLIFWTQAGGPIVLIRDFVQESDCKQIGEVQKKMTRDPNPNYVCVRQAK